MRWLLWVLLAPLGALWFVSTGTAVVLFAGFVIGGGFNGGLLERGAALVASALLAGLAYLLTLTMARLYQKVRKD